MVTGSTLEACAPRKFHWPPNQIAMGSTLEACAPRKLHRPPNRIVMGSTLEACPPRDWIVVGSTLEACAPRGLRRPRRPLNWRTLTKWNLIRLGRLFLQDRPKHWWPELGA